MTSTIHIDFETYSGLDLRVVGLHSYARHPSTGVWCMAWALGDAPVQIWVAGDPVPETVAAHVRDGYSVYAHNAPFELEIWNNIMARRLGWPPLRPEQTHCTLAMCLAMGLPGALEDAAMALGLEDRKDKEGRALMLKMARAGYKADIDSLLRLYDYCRQDVVVERAIHKRVMPLSKRERQVWLMDYAINQRGIRADLESARAGVEMAEKVKAQLNEEMARLTDGEVQTCSALIALKEWLSVRGLPEAADGLDKEAVLNALSNPDLSPEVVRALTLRQEAGKASTAKLQVMLDIAGEGDRMRHLVQYHGASTGRWAARKVQVHNFPRDVPPAEEVEDVLRLVREGSTEFIDAVYGPPMSVLSRCLRGFMLAAPGHQLIAGDFSNVEGRGVAWFSGEEWKVRAFEAADKGTGPGIYELAYSRMYGVPPESVKNPSPERQRGKVAELALGYQGGVGAFQAMARVYGVHVTDEQADEFKRLWRAAHPKGVNTWYDLQRAAIAAVRSPGILFSAGHPARPAKFKVVGSFLWCQLPSGRAICYPYPKILPGLYGEQLTYMTVPPTDGVKKGKIISDSQNAPRWARMGTYGGSLMENIVQGFCRDLMADCMLRLDDVVLHVHDEIVQEVPDDERLEERRQHMQNVMCTPPAWAAGFPLHAKCFTMKRYGK